MTLGAVRYDLDRSCEDATTVPVDICRLGLDVTTSDRPAIVKQVWLPQDWSGRFVTTGNGGVGGCLDCIGMAYAAAPGFPTTRSNDGHSGQNGTSFLNNLDVMKDCSCRLLSERKSRISSTTGRTRSRDASAAQLVAGKAATRDC